MSRLNILESKVRALYEEKRDTRADLADWLYENHIFVVAENASKLVDRFGGRKDIAVAASMLHDVADAVMLREDKRHEEKSNSIAEKFLKESNFSEDEIKTIVDDAIRFHGCKNGEIPKTLEGKIMATADALAHLQTNFYDFIIDFYKGKDSLEDIKNWGLSKIERDYRDKIFFEEVREEVTSSYDRLKTLFLNL